MIQIIYNTLNSKKSKVFDNATERPVMAGNQNRHE
jgi:hypothetical protein